jgi:hypothetical protein
LERLAAATTLQADEITLLPPEQSVELESRIYRRMRTSMRDGTIVRMCGLSSQNAITSVSRWLQSLDVPTVDVLLARNKDFSFRCRPEALDGRLAGLIDFDGETVTILAHDGETGCALDYEGHSGSEKHYEVDSWGNRHAAG